MKLRSWFFALLAVFATATLSLAQVAPGVNSNIASVFNLVWEQSTMKPTYSATQTVTLASSATDVCALSGSATRSLVKVRRVILSTFGSGAQVEAVGLIKRSAVATGAGAQPTIVPYDTVNVISGTASNAATAVVETWTSNPTPGTAVGFIADPVLSFTPTNGTRTVFTFGELASPVILRGVAQSLAVNLNGVTVTAGALTCTFEWTEEP